MTDQPPLGSGPNLPAPDELWLRRLLLAGSIGILLVLAYQLLRPILPAILWGGLLATVSAHAYERIVSRAKGNRMVGILVIGLIYLLVLVGPLLLIAIEAATYAPYLAALPERLTSGDLLKTIESAEAASEIKTGLKDWLSSFQTNFSGRLAQVLPQLGGVAAWFAARLGDVGGFLFEFVLGCATALALLYDRFSFRAYMSRFLERIGGEPAKDLMQKTFDSTRGAFQGVVVAALAQTVLTALALAIVGIPGIVLLCAVTFMLALVQIGPLVIGLIASGYLLADGSVVAAVMVMLWFVVVVTSVDNLIRPYFAARVHNTPAFLTFLGALGGILAFGLIGVFVGPVLIALLHSVLMAWLTDGTGQLEG